MAEQTPFSTKRAYLREPDFFPRFRVPDAREPLAQANLADDEDLFLVEHDGARRALMLRHLIYHHVAEGSVGGKPFVLALCADDHTAAAFSPMVRGEVFHFSAGGLYEHRALLIDDETHSYWNPRNGVALHGPLKGTALEPMPVVALTAREAMAQHPGADLARSHLALRAHAVAWFNKICSRAEGATLRHLTEMRRGDSRLPENTHGLGVLIGDQVRFFPVSQLRTETRVHWAGRQVIVRKNPAGAYAQWEDGSRPLQLQLPWADFAYAFPECIVADDSENEAA